MPNLLTVEPSYRRYALHERGHQPTTVKHTLSIVRKLCAFSETYELTGFNTHTIRSFLQISREENKWSAKTFRIYRQYLKTFFDWVVSEQWITDNPVDSISSPRLPINLPRCLNRDEALKFLSSVHHYPWTYELEEPRNKAIIAMFLYTGIRLGELLNLRMDHVDLAKREILIRQGKNEKDRCVTIHEDLLPILVKYCKAAKKQGTPSMWFFPSVRSEKQLTQKNIYAIFRKVSAQSGIKATPHMLRHTFGRLSVESNINMRVIQRMMGHSNIQTTQIYTHVTTEAMKQAMNRFSLI